MRLLANQQSLRFMDVVSRLLRTCNVLFNLHSPEQHKRKSDETPLSFIVTLLWNQVQHVRLTLTNAMRLVGTTNVHVYL